MGGPRPKRSTRLATQRASSSAGFVARHVEELALPKEVLKEDISQLLQPGLCEIVSNEGIEEILHGYVEGAAPIRQTGDLQLCDPAEIAQKSPASASQPRNRANYSRSVHSQLSAAPQHDASPDIMRVPSQV